MNKQLTLEEWVDSILISKTIKPSSRAKVLNDQNIASVYTQWNNALVGNAKLIACRAGKVIVNEILENVS